MTYRIVRAHHHDDDQIGRVSRTLIEEHAGLDRAIIAYVKHSDAVDPADDLTDIEFWYGEERIYNPLTPALIDEAVSVWALWNEREAAEVGVPDIFGDLMKAAIEREAAFAPDIPY